jgi:hypothetical protein
MAEAEEPRTNGPENRGPIRVQSKEEEQKEAVTAGGSYGQPSPRF